MNEIMVGKVEIGRILIFAR